MSRTPYHKQFFSSINQRGSTRIFSMTEFWDTLCMSRNRKNNGHPFPSGQTGNTAQITGGANISASIFPAGSMLCALRGLPCNSATKELKNGSLQRK
jgi:hypothetical protein